jgi:2-polyprenyl-3-methyl-5-hydroxy-6-metoxy-1,4-benzoquinol methylase
MKHTEKNITQRTQAVWGTKPAGHTHAPTETPGTKEYFEQVLLGRFTKEHDWLPAFVDYPAFKYKKVLEVGCGAGYDAYMFCKNGAEYTGIDLTPENIHLTQKHLGYYGLSGTILQMDATAITLTEKFDLIYSFGVLHHVPNIHAALENIHTVMADDGQFYLIIYNKNSVFYRLGLWFTWIAKREFLKETFKERLSRIEYTTSNERPHVDVYTMAEAKKLLQKNGFLVIESAIHQLTAADFPHVFRLGHLWNKIPNSWLTLLGEYFGWYICIKAKK